MPQEFFTTAAPGSEAAVQAADALQLLLVEDNPHVAETLAELLELEGYKVLVAPDAAAGLDIVQQRQVDVVLCDLTLPGEIDGFGFARACRRHPPLSDMHLLAVSGYDRPEDRERAQASGFDGLIGKPVDLDRLRAMINRGRPR